MSIGELPVVEEQPRDRAERDRKALPIVNDRVREEVARERERLLKEAGLGGLPVNHFKKPVERPFTRAEREKTTLLIGGLTVRHDELMLAGLQGLGYKVARLPTPVKADFQAGKEYGNNGQCNPTYFTVGNLVNYLKDMRDKQGMPTEEIVRDNLFLTAGACGPCRFGMYEAEYRLALRNSGFDGFRVLIFDQSGGATGGEAEGGGLEFSLEFVLMLLNGLFMGDLLNEVGYQIRPFEVVPGSTDAALAECLKMTQDALKGRHGATVKAGWMSRFLARRLPLTSSNDLSLVLDQVRGDHYTGVLRACKDLLNEKVQVDYTRAKPIVKVTGEFWAQTTEGDGNFRMFSFLEGEGAQVLVEPVGTWIGYTFHCMLRSLRDSGGVGVNETPPRWWNVVGQLRRMWRYRTQLHALSLIDRLVGREYERLRMALGGTAHHLVNQLELQRLGHPYYNAKSEGGEGHMEVAKNIYYANNNLAHMVLSLKPFGCMPSTQSDGTQSAVMNHFKDMIFLPIETSGEGDINAHSRVQMALGEAKSKSKAEFQEVLGRTGYTLEQIQAYVGEHPELRRPIQTIPTRDKVIGQAANFVLHVAEQMKAAGVKVGQAVCAS